MWSKLVVLVAVAGGVAYSGHYSASTSNCEGGRCCVLTPPPSNVNCCYIGSECCYPGSRCCELGATAEKASCCPDGACCPDGECCAAQAKAGCCGPDSPCCPSGACCGGK